MKVGTRISLLLGAFALGLSCAESDKPSDCQFRVSWAREGNETLTESSCAESIDNRFESTNLTIKKTNGEIVILSGKFKIERENGMINTFEEFVKWLYKFKAKRRVFLTWEYIGEAYLLRIGYVNVEDHVVPYDFNLDGYPPGIPVFSGDSEDEVKRLVVAWFNSWIDTGYTGVICGGSK